MIYTNVEKETVEHINYSHDIVQILQLK